MAKLYFGVCNFALKPKNFTKDFAFLLPGLPLVAGVSPPVPGHLNRRAIQQHGLRRLQDPLQLRLLLRLHHRHAVYYYDAYPSSV